MSEQPHLSQTAPIDEYRVLWTTVGKYYFSQQKKQKLKKWHDGFLRFHKFNKRMLVYDDARHLVADMYLRGRDAIEEGDDLEFEHHLVTIEDFKETVVQDLTPLFSPALQRKKQIQAGNALLNSPTPNQANRHGPWGPSRHATMTPQPPQQRRSQTPQTPIQRRPIGAPGLTLQQAARQAINHQTLPQDRFSKSVQQLSPDVPVGISPNADLPQGLNPALRSNQPRTSHSLPKPKPPQRPGLLTNPVQLPRKPRQNSPPKDQSTIKLPVHVLDGPLSRSRRPNPPPAPLQRLCLSSPESNGTASCASSRAKPQPPATATLDSEANFDPIRLSPDPASSRRLSPPAGPKNVASRPVQSRANKRAPDVAFDEDSDYELFGPPPDFQVFASPSEPAPVSRQNSISSDSGPPYTSKRPSRETRPFKPPTKRKPNGTPIVAQPEILETIAISIDKNDGPIPESEEDSEKESTSEPLVNAGTLRLDNGSTRKRNKLLCQRPLNHPTAAPKAQPTPSITSLANNATKKSKTKLISKNPSLTAAEDLMVIDNGSPDDKPKISTVNHRKPSHTSRGSKAVRKPIEGRGNNREKGKVCDPGPKEDYRIHEEEHSLQYQKDNDVGPWSSEAFDLFDWRPPNMEGRK